MSLDTKRYEKTCEMNSMDNTAAIIRLPNSILLWLGPLDNS